VENGASGGPEAREDLLSKPDLSVVKDVVKGPVASYLGDYGRADAPLQKVRNEGVP